MLYFLGILHARPFLLIHYSLYELEFRVLTEKNWTLTKSGTAGKSLTCDRKTNPTVPKCSIPESAEAARCGSGFDRRTDSGRACCVSWGPECTRAFPGQVA